MELIIYNPQEGDFLQQIEWNYEDLKAEITKKTQEYASLVYTEDQIQDAKKDRAALNKLITALENKRKEIKKAVMVPYDGFEKQEKELKAIVEKAVKSIDDQVKGYEQKQKDEKLKKVQEIYRKCIKDLDRVLPFEKVFKDSYLNKGTTLKSIQADMEELYEKVDRELKIIGADMSPYTMSMKQAYLETLDLTIAMEKRNELEEADRWRKQEEEHRQKEINEKDRLAQERDAVFDRNNYQSRHAEMAAQAPEMARMPMLTHEGKVVYQDVTATGMRRKRIVVSITANETQFDYLNKALGELKANSEELKVLEKEDL